MMDPVWEQLHGSRDWGQYPAVDLISHVKRQFREMTPDSLRVLEVGCGVGANLSFFVREGFQVSGIDGAPFAIRRSTERLSPLLRTAQELDLRVGDFRELPWEASRFDVVVDYLAIYANRLSTIRAAIGECFRVLKPGGFMFSRSWARGCTGDKTGIMLEPGTSANPTCGPCAGHGTSHFFDETELRDLFRGFATFDLSEITQAWKTRDLVVKEWVVWARK